MQSTEKLRDLLTSDIKRFDADSTKHKLIYRRVQSTIIGLTAVTAIMAGVGLVVENADNRIQFTILCLAATTTALSTWIEMRRARELWQHEREVHYALKDLLRELDFYDATGSLTEEDINALFRRAQGILGSSTTSWLGIQQRQQGEGTGG